MAKRKRPPDKNPSLLRRGEKTFQEISDYALTLGEQAAEMKALADAMTKAGLETVPMDGVTKMDRALELAHDFLGNFETALVESRRQKKKAQLESRRAKATAASERGGAAADPASRLLQVASNLEKLLSSPKGGGLAKEKAELLAQTKTALKRLKKELGSD